MRYRLILCALITCSTACSEAGIQNTSGPRVAETAPPSEREHGIAPPAVLQPRSEPEPERTREAKPPVTPEHGGLGSSIPVNLAPGDQTEYFVRARRRMNLDQLQAQIAHATGGREWVVNGDNQFEELAATLGRPDYIATLFEDLSAGPVFQKFLGDAARAICTEMATDEPALPVEDRVLLATVTAEDTVASNPAAVDANLVQLMLRFHGLAVQADAPVLSKYRWLFESVSHTTNDPVQGWKVVCIALMSHPRFYSY